MYAGTWHLAAPGSCCFKKFDQILLAGGSVHEMVLSNAAAALSSGEVLSRSSC
jgi:hypothetical protein